MAAVHLHAPTITPLRPGSKGHQRSLVERHTSIQHSGGAAHVDQHTIWARPLMARRVDGLNTSRIVLTAASVQPAESTSDAEVTSLYQRLGGSDGIDAVVKLFYQKVYSDARVNKWFDGVSQAGQMKKMSRFVRFATGSGEEYGPKDLGRPHAKLVERGLQDEDYDVIVELFTEALADAGVPQAIASEVATILDSVRGQVLGRE